MSVDETMSSQSVSAFREECYTETIFHAGLLKKALFDGRGNPEIDLQNFYSSFYQLWLISRDALNTKNRLTSKRDNSDLSENIKEWFNGMVNPQNRVLSARKMSESGLLLAEQWLTAMNAAGII